MKLVRNLILAPLLAALLVAPEAALARDGYVTSFDGTKIVYSFFPAPGLKPGQTAPTVMNGPGWGSSRADQTDQTVSALLAAGYNVLTWDPRGFGDSGGNVELDSPEYEARDASALVDFIARQPEAQLDKPGDPRLGMIGGSYGGGIQNNLAATDPRVDVITPSIAWHSLITALDKNDTPKTGFGAALIGLGVASQMEGGLTGGLSGQPAGFQFGRSQDPRTMTAVTDAAVNDKFTAADQAWFASRGPTDGMAGVKIPTLITQGTVDGLFTLHEGIENYDAEKAAGAPIQMIWFCGGHGLCLDSTGPDPNIVLDASLRWLNRYLKHDTSVATGGGFQWVSDKGTLHSAAAYPPPHGTPVTGTGSGTLPLVPGDTSGIVLASAIAANAVNIKLATPPAGTELVGEPTLTITYSGTASQPDARVYAQIIHDQTSRPLGNEITPVPVTLDGKTHTASFSLEAVAADAGGADTYTLQITDGSSMYFAAREAGAITFSKASVSIPTVAAGASTIIPPPPAAAIPPTSQTTAANAKANRCAPAIGTLRGASLGPVRLGRTRAEVRRAFSRIRRPRGSMDLICLSGGGIRVGYPSSAVVRSMSRRDRARTSGRDVLLLTSNPQYALDRVVTGTKVSDVAARLHVSAPLNIGANTWYLVPGRLATGLLDTRHGIVQQIGIADRALTTGRSRALRFLRSFV